MQVKKKWQRKHYEVLKEFVNYLNKRTGGFVLKGGTALMLCYGLDRFSEDIDFDSTETECEEYVKGYCEKNGFEYRVAKKTKTVERYMIHYSGEGKPLKVEISHRRVEISPQETVVKNGIRVYNINQMAVFKANAYTARDKIRDLYDICFICNTYWEELDSDIKAVVRTAIEYKGIEQCEFVIKDQGDELIDSDKLITDFLSAYDKIGLLNPE